MVAAVVTMIGRSRTTVGDDDVEEEMLTITGPGETNGRKFKKWSSDEEEAITLAYDEFSGPEGCWKDVAAMAVDRTPAAVTEKWKVMQRERKPLASARWYPSGDSKGEMESAMAGGSMPSATEISYLASRFGVPYEKVKIWCQNHTARARRSAGTHRRRAGGSSAGATRRRWRRRTGSPNPGFGTANRACPPLNR